MSDLSHVVTGLSGVDREGARCSRAADMEAVSSVWGVGKPISPSKESARVKWTWRIDNTAVERRARTNSQTTGR